MVVESLALQSAKQTICECSGLRQPSVASGSARSWLGLSHWLSGQVNTTLDCDTPETCFQHVASILVIDGGQPRMTSK
jgi:hypothetical protein